MADMKSFSSRLQWLAINKKVVQADLARALKQSSSAISRWWNGNFVPGNKNVRLIAGYFGCDVDWLAYGEGHPFPAHEKSRSIVSDNGIKAGRGGVKIRGGEKVRAYDKQHDAPLVFDEEEIRFIALVREVGGKQALRKFKKELLRLQQIIDKELE